MATAEDIGRKGSNEDGDRGWPAVDQEALVATVLDYFEGWFDGDPARMERALHPELAKRGPGDGPSGLESTTAREMIEATARGVGRARDVPDRDIRVHVEDVHGSIASVTVRSAVYREYLHLIRTAAGWRIANALWQRT